jgi:hypothetical protein
MLNRLSENKNRCGMVFLFYCVGSETNVFWRPWGEEDGWPGAPGSLQFSTLIWGSTHRRGSQVTAQKTGGNLGTRAVFVSP